LVSFMYESEMSRMKAIIVIMFPRPVYLANIGVAHACHVFDWSLMAIPPSAREVPYDADCPHVSNWPFLLKCKRAVGAHRHVSLESKERWVNYMLFMSVVSL
jgi:hypothetical protein